MCWFSTIQSMFLWHGELSSFSSSYVSPNSNYIEKVLRQIQSFQAVLNHEESIMQLSKALSQIVDILPRAELSLILYPTQAMMENAARLYAHILRFTQRAIVWYRHGKLKHCWDAIARPWAVRFKDECEEIEQRSRQMDNLASAASKAELRDTHLELTEARKELLRVSQGNAQLMALCRQYFPQLVDFAHSMQTQILMGIFES